MQPPLWEGVEVETRWLHFCSKRVSLFLGETYWQNQSLLRLGKATNVLCHHLLESLGISDNIRELARTPYKSGAFIDAREQQTKSSLTDWWRYLRSAVAAPAKIRTALNNSSKTTLSVF